MSQYTPPSASLDNGAFISTGKIYEEVRTLKEEMVRLKTVVSLVSAIVAPLLSTIVATVTVSVMNGGQ